MIIFFKNEFDFLKQNKSKLIKYFSNWLIVDNFSFENY